MVEAKMTELGQSQDSRYFSPVMVTPWPAASDTTCVSNNSKKKKKKKIPFTNSRNFYYDYYTLTAPINKRIDWSFISLWGLKTKRNTWTRPHLTEAWAHLGQTFKYLWLRETRSDRSSAARSPKSWLLFFIYSVEIRPETKLSVVVFSHDCCFLLVCPWAGKTGSEWERTDVQTTSFSFTVYCDGSF